MHGWRDHDAAAARRSRSSGSSRLREAAAAPAEVVELAERARGARRDSDFARGDRLRDEIDAAGWEVRDVEAEPGFQLVPKR